MTFKRGIYQICRACGIKYCHMEMANTVCSVWKGTCDICGDDQSFVCPPYDFGGLKQGWDKEF